ncbi:hypothetical protein DL89DRAFT_265663, partial [Linderina pennispora]
RWILILWISFPNSPQDYFLRFPRHKPGDTTIFGPLNTLIISNVGRIKKLILLSWYPKSYGEDTDPIMKELLRLRDGSAQTMVDQARQPDAGSGSSTERHVSHHKVPRHH